MKSDVLASNAWESSETSSYKRERLGVPTHLLATDHLGTVIYEEIIHTLNANHGKGGSDETSRK